MGGIASCADHRGGGQVDAGGARGRWSVLQKPKATPKTMLKNGREPRQCVAPQIGDLAGLRCSNWSCKDRDPLLVKVTI